MRNALLLWAAVLGLVVLLSVGAHDAAAYHDSRPCQPTLPPGIAATDTDEDGLPDTCESYDNDPDADDDGFSDSREVYNGTQPFQACSSTGTPNDETRPAFPMDWNDDQKVNLTEAVILKLGFNAHMSQPRFQPRLDSNADENVNLADATRLKMVFNSVCPEFPGSGGMSPPAGIHVGSGYLHPAPLFVGNELVRLANVFAGLDCYRLWLAMDQWARTTNFKFNANDDCVDPAASVTVRWQDLAPAKFAAEVIPFLGGRICSDPDPCVYADSATVRLNSSNEQMTGVGDIGAAFRHQTLTHEFGHVIGFNHPYDRDDCVTIAQDRYFSIMLPGPECAPHWPRITDVVFTNVSY